MSLLPPRADGQAELPERAGSQAELAECAEVQAQLSERTEAPAGGSRSDRAGWIVAALAVFVALLMLGHSLVPNTLGNAGSLLETFLPWLGVSVPVLLAAALLRRSAVACAAVALTAIVWCSLFAGTVLDKSSTGGDLSVVSHNVHDGNPDPKRTARDLAASGADVIALQELTSRTAPVYERTLADAYPYHAVRESVGLWSKRPLRAAEPLAIMPWTRALRATVDTPKGPLAVYVAHLASIRVHPSSGFATEKRNEAAARLAGFVREEKLPRVVVVGDLNGTTDDRALRPLTSRLRSAQEEAGQGFGFSWPAAFPVVRLDQVLARGVTPVSAWTLPRTGSDHLPVAASFRL
ncbi:endonuclease/exonuclease/phosphatase family protein [Streptomyces sp. AN091965]|nr:endonuclease/exonuclease/phosphatase family protein [Streptomyces sp. AN091965]MCI3930209.1 endonuclease/exonuclease/phosphatase family protein [Streptomyces sp. AN091965]